MDLSELVVMVVDDNEMDRYILCRQLSHLNIASITQLASLDETMSHLRLSLESGANIPHLILLDYYLGDTTGSVCANQIKALFKQVDFKCPILVLMSSASIAELENEQNTFDACLSKGTSISDLSLTLQNIFN